MNTPACHAIRKAGMIVMRWANIAVLIVSLGSSILKSNQKFHNTLPKRKRVAKNMIPPMTAPIIATTIAALDSWMSMSIMSCFMFYYFAVLWKQIVPQKYGFFCGTIVFFTQNEPFLCIDTEKTGCFCGTCSWACAEKWRFGARNRWRETRPAIASTAGDLHLYANTLSLSWLHLVPSVLSSTR